VIVGGALVLSTLLDELGIDQLLVSERDILDGLAASLL
jgi:exopolyphosphatase/pppGpp-phosphohydrolase